MTEKQRGATMREPLGLVETNDRAERLPAEAGRVVVPIDLFRLRDERFDVHRAKLAREVRNDLLIFHESRGGQERDGPVARHASESVTPCARGIAERRPAIRRFRHQLCEEPALGKPAGDVAVYLGDSPARGRPVKVESHDARSR